MPFSCTRYWTVKIGSTSIETECANDEWPWSWFQFWMLKNKQKSFLWWLSTTTTTVATKHNPLREYGGGAYTTYCVLCWFLFSYFSTSFSLLLPLVLLLSSSSFFFSLISKIFLTFTKTWRIVLLLRPSCRSTGSTGKNVGGFRDLGYGWTETRNLEGHGRRHALRNDEVQAKGSRRTGRSWRHPGERSMDDDY
jgi:hypothetical protein